MKIIKNWNKVHSLKTKITAILLISGIFCGIVCLLLFNLFESMVTNYFDNPDVEKSLTYRQGEKLQQFIDENDISSNDLAEIGKWISKNPVIMLEIFDGNRQVYNSYTGVVKESEAIIEDIYANESYNVYTLKLTDKNVGLLLYADFSYKYYILADVAAFVLSLLLFIAIFLTYNKRIVSYMIKLSDEVQILEGGNLDYPITIKGNDELSDLAKSMECMRLAFKEQLANEQELYNSKSQLVSEMSHDIRTPLTAMMLYTEILRNHRYTSQTEFDNYLKKIDDKARHIKNLSDNLFDCTLDDGLEITVIQTMKAAFLDCVDSLVDDLKLKGFRVMTSLDWKDVKVSIKDASLVRIFENIVSNMSKYANKAANINIETIYTDKYCGLVFLNICSNDTDSENSSGIGLESIKTLMRQMDGRFAVDKTESSFEMTLLFPIVN